MNFTKTLLSIVFVLFAPIALAESLDKVEVCHLSDEGEVNTISISENAIDVHMAHGDVYVDEDGDCVFQLCLGEQYYAGLGYGDYYYEFSVLYFPASGEITTDQLPGIIFTGLVSPAGYSIFSAGSHYSYSYHYPDYPTSDFVGAGMTFDDSGTFVGIWKRPDDRTDATSIYPSGEADTDYTFSPGACAED